MSPSHNPLIIKERHKLQTRPHTGVDIARWADLLIGVVPSINLEWIQKIHRDCNVKGHSPEAVANTIMRHLPDYVGYITPQFSLTDINFQRVPLVDTSNPFIARDVPTLAESMVVIRFREPKDVDFPNLLQRIHDSFMSRPNTLVVPGGEMMHAMSVICAPMVHKLLEKLPRKYARKYPDRAPAAKLARLAVTTKLQRKGLGSHMMINAIERILAVSEHLGIIGFFVDAKNAEAKAYYEQFGFIPLPDNPLELFLPISTLYKAYVQEK